VTGQVERVSEYPVALGSFNDIYVGELAAYKFFISPLNMTPYLGKWADDRKVGQSPLNTKQNPHFW
jgi:hypothetical protein